MSLVSMPVYDEIFMSGACSNIRERYCESPHLWESNLDVNKFNCYLIMLMKY